MRKLILPFSPSGLAAQIQLAIFPITTVLRRVITCAPCWHPRQIHIQHPVQPVFDAPVCAHRAPQRFTIQIARTDVITPLPLCPLITHLPPPISHADTLAKLASPSCHIPAAESPALSAPLSGHGGLDHRPRHGCFTQFDHCRLNRLLQRGLVTFDRQQVITSLLVNLCPMSPTATMASMLTVSP